ncbi:anthranilate phosphoribosyltransferase [Sulfuriroseicoccus oceanibius]|uniref:Anthranilate phosphoribosyltransferase n=1 Tax=Sulfuriroseicoccus oceanibius TaxID=2707525 RepID=A0A7T7F0F0_9BACT|nr:anthranilate phosphoribosyltransferase [Sulfuriroseicoccus oceanibius]QQL44255.1 anthranilate phosphoribosyltransferase [Sulfuriroseicoccus oceanibius]
MNILTSAVDSLRVGQDLPVDLVTLCADALIAQDTADADRLAFLEALAAKGESTAEIEAFVRAFLRHAVDPQVDASDFEEPLFDIVGTGGDKLNLFNVSSTAMFILAGAGVVPVKHANRAVTSKSGGADLLDALGVKIDLAPSQFAEALKQAKIGFLFAPVYHPAFAAVVPVRKELAARGVRTVFNLLGPHLNPVKPDHQLIGVYDAAMVDQFAEIMKALGRKSGWVVHGTTGEGQGMDEVSILGETQVARVVSGQPITRSVLAAAEVGGVDADGLEQLVGGTARENAQITKAILSGDERGAPRRMAVANAAAGLCAAGVCESMEQALDRANESLDSGKAVQRLKALIDATNA